MSCGEWHAFYRLPRAHHKHLKSTNMLERLNEIKCLRSATSAMTTRFWLLDMLYISARENSIQHAGLVPHYAALLMSQCLTDRRHP